MDAGDSEGHTYSAWRVGVDPDRLRGEALFAHSSDAIIDIDPAGAIMAFNPAAERLLGYHAGDVVGGRVGMLVPDRSPEEGEVVLADLTGRRDVEPYAINYRRPDDEMLDLSVTAVPLVLTDGSSAGLTVIARDLTVLHRSQAALDIPRP